MALQNTQHHPSSCCWAAKGPTDRPTSLPGKQRSGLQTASLEVLQAERAVGREPWEPLRSIGCSQAAARLRAALLCSPPTGFTHQSHHGWVCRATASRPSGNRKENLGASEENKQQTVSAGRARTAVTARRTGDGSLELGDEGNAGAAWAPAESGLPGGSHSSTSTL